MPRPRKRAAGYAPETEMEAPSGKCTKATKTETLDKPVVEAETCDSSKDQVTKGCGNEPSAYWLMKSEPESQLEKGINVKFGIENLKAQPKHTACWDGVRNYQAQNFLRAMKLGEEAFFYHSNCKEPGIAVFMKIMKEAYPNHTQFEKNRPDYDPSSKKDNPKWSMVDVQFIRMTKRFIPLAELKVHHQVHKANVGALENMALFTCQRFSVQPLTQGESDFFLSLEDKKPS